MKHLSLIIGILLFSLPFLPVVAFSDATTTIERSRVAELASPKEIRGTDFLSSGGSRISGGGDAIACFATNIAYNFLREGEALNLRLAKHRKHFIDAQGFLTRLGRTDGVLLSAEPFDLYQILIAQDKEQSDNLKIPLLHFRDVNAPFDLVLRWIDDQLGRASIELWTQIQWARKQSGIIGQAPTVGVQGLLNIQDSGKLEKSDSTIVLGLPTNCTDVQAAYRVDTIIYYDTDVVAKFDGLARAILQTHEELFYLEKIFQYYGFGKTVMTSHNAQTIIFELLGKTQNIFDAKDVLKNNGFEWIFSVEGRNPIEYGQYLKEQLQKLNGAMKDFDRALPDAQDAIDEMDSIANQLTGLTEEITAGMQKISRLQQSLEISMFFLESWFLAQKHFIILNAKLKEMYAAVGLPVIWPATSVIEASDKKTFVELIPYQLIETKVEQQIDPHSGVPQKTISVNRALEFDNKKLGIKYPKKPIFSYSAPITFTGKSRVDQWLEVFSFQQLIAKVIQHPIAFFGNNLKINFNFPFETIDWSAMVVKNANSEISASEIPETDFPLSRPFGKVVLNPLWTEIKIIERKELHELSGIIQKLVCLTISDSRFAVAEKKSSAIIISDCLPKQSKFLEFQIKSTYDRLQTKWKEAIVRKQLLVLDVESLFKQKTTTMINPDFFDVTGNN